MASDNRVGEQVGAGFFVFWRGRRSGRIKPATPSFEHPTLEAARAEAEVLARAHPGRVFEVFARAFTAPVISEAEAALERIDFPDGDT